MINRVILMGRLTADVELKQTASNVANCRFTVAITRNFAPKGEERQSDFVTVVAWRQTAEFVAKYFTKGKSIIVEGSLRNNNYEDKNGVKHYGMDVYADNVAFGESKGGNADNSPATSPANTAPNFGNLEDFEEIITDGKLPF